MSETGSSIISRLVRLLPILMIGMALFGIVMFGASNTAPALRTYQELSSQLEAGQQALAQAAAAGADDSAAIMEQRIASLDESMGQAGGLFMTGEQAEDILSTLYLYADSNGVEIRTLQTQNSEGGSGLAAQLRQPSGTKGEQSSRDAENDAQVYAVAAFRLQVDGDLIQLMKFVAAIREATIPSVVIQNLALKATDDGGVLLLDLLAYTSPYASGDVFAALPTIALPPTPSPAAGGDAVVMQGENGLAEAPAQPMPTETALPLVFSEGFDADLAAWRLGAGWRLVNDEANPMLEVSDSSSEVTYISNTLWDAAVQARVLLESGNFRLSLRQSGAGRYSLVLDSLGQIALYRGDSLIQSAVSLPSGVSRWRDVRLSVVQGVLRAAVDGTELITALDAEQLPPGTLSFALIGSGLLRLDDIRVWAAP